MCLVCATSISVLTPQGLVLRCRSLTCEKSKWSYIEEIGNTEAIRLRLVAIDEVHEVLVHGRTCSASEARARGDHAAAVAVHDMLATAEAMRTFCTTTRCRRRVLLSAMCSPLGYWVPTRWCCDNCHCNGMQCG